MNTVIESILSEQLAEASDSMELLMRKIHRRQARVGIIGLGYVGLPLAIEFARAGFSVTGFDIDRRRTEQANNGSSYIGDVNDQILSASDRDRSFPRNELTLLNFPKWTRFPSASRHLCARPKTRTSLTSSRPWRRSRTTSTEGS